MADESRALDEAFGAIEETILPTLPGLLDALLEAASLARPGIDAGAYAAELRRLGGEVASLGRLVEEAAAEGGEDQAACAA